jgi:tocopherol O-methyltransferase
MTGPSLEEVRAYFDETRLDYRVLWSSPRDRALHFGHWSAGTRSHHESLLEMNAVLADAIGIRPGDRVLDAGCGFGGSAFWLARHRGASVTGITAVPGQVRSARRYLRRLELGERVRFFLGDFAATRFRSRSFDVAWFIESLDQASDLSQVVREARRLLRPGGRIGLADFVAGTRAGDADCARMLRLWTDGWAMRELSTEDDLVNILREAGFTDVRSIDVTPNVRRSVSRLHRIATYLWPLQSFYRRIGIRSQRQHAHVVASRTIYPALRAGCWRYVIVTATAGS